MSRLVVALSLALVLALCGVGYSVSKVYEYKGLAEDANSALVKAQARTAKIQALVKKADKDAAKARSDLKEALDAYPVWRDAAVPGPVHDSLCRTLRCIEPGGMSSPSGGSTK